MGNLISPLSVGSILGTQLDVGKETCSNVRFFFSVRKEQALIWCLCSSTHLLEEYHLSSSLSLWWNRAFSASPQPMILTVLQLLHQTTCPILHVPTKPTVLVVLCNSRIFLKPLASNCGQSWFRPTLTENTLDLTARMQTGHTLGSHSRPHAI